MTDKEKIHFLEFMIRNIGDQIYLKITDFGRNDKTYIEDGKEILFTIIYKISELQKYEK